MQEVRYLKTYGSFLNEAKTLTLFRGQTDEFYDEKAKKGYQEHYSMLFLSNDVNNAYFYTNPERSKVREILIFEVPDKIAQVQGVYIDRLGSDKLKELQEEGYVGVTSNVGELMADKGEVGMFKNYKPVKRFQTTDGKFSEEDITVLKKYGLSSINVKRENSI